jgi:hypothetical protein
MAKTNKPTRTDKSARVATQGETLVKVDNIRMHFPIQTGLIASILNKGHTSRPSKRWMASVLKFDAVRCLGWQ